jgi:hypothetical protein
MPHTSTAVIASTMATAGMLTAASSPATAEGRVTPMSLSICAR